MIERAAVLACVAVAGALIGLLGRSWSRRPATTSAALPAGLWLFTSPYCPPCKHVRDQLSAKSLTCREVSVVERPDLVRAFDVRSAPTLVMVDAEGRVTDSLVGFDAVEFRRFLSNVDSASRSFEQ